MSNPSSLSNESLARSPRESDATRSPPIDRFAARLKGPVQFCSFWAAIALPFVHLTLLAGGLESVGTIALFVGLLALNLLALYVGHDYKQG